MKRIVAALLIALPFSVFSQVVDIGRPTFGGSGRQALKVPINGVISVVLPSGQRALIQFTKIDEYSAEYRWKYRRGSGAPIEVGTGAVAEKYQQVPIADGPHGELRPLPGHDVVVRAGEIRTEWSRGGENLCYFYFNPSLAQGTLLSADAFLADP